MPSIRIWTPESDFDSKAVRCIAEKIVAFYGSDIKVLEASKMAYNQAFQKNQKDGLQKQVNIYLKTSDLVIFLIDYDGIQSYTQRSKEPNSLVNRITEVVNFIDKAILIYIKQEVESWLLVDCLGICCYFTNDENIRKKQDWIEFSTKKQHGNTELIIESVPGGRGAKEYLVNFSDSVNLKINPNLAQKLNNLKQKRYSESDSPQVAKYIEINSQTLTRNESLRGFAELLKKL